MDNALGSFKTPLTKFIMSTYFDYLPCGVKIICSSSSKGNSQNDEKHNKIRLKVTNNEINDCIKILHLFDA